MKRRREEATVVVQDFNIYIDGDIEEEQFIEHVEPLVAKSLLLSDALSMRPYPINIFTCSGEQLLLFQGWAQLYNQVKITLQTFQTTKQLRQHEQYE